MDRAAGVVLCGGRSRRMGRPKAWLPVGREPLLPRTVRLLSQVVTPIVVVAAVGQELPPLPPDVTIARDAAPDRGPLQGIAAGLSELDMRAEIAFVSSCDAPFLAPAFVRRILDRIGGYAACVPEVGGRRHPLAAAYRVSMRPVVEDLLRRDRRRVLDLFDAVPTRFLGPADFADVDPDLRSLRNVNTPDEYAAAVRELADRG